MKQGLTKYQVLTPQFHLGEVMGELNTRKGWLECLYQCGEEFLVEALVPEQNMADFAKWLANVSRGQGKIFVVAVKKDA